MLRKYFRASQMALVVKNSPANAGDKRHEFDSWIRKIPWRRKCQVESQTRLKQLSMHIPSIIL